MKKTERKPNLLIFASGTKDGGGSGFGSLVDAQKCKMLDANISGVVSQYKSGGVNKIAEANGVHFFWFPGPYDFRNYNYVIREYDSEWVALSGWTKKIEGHDPEKTFNIHPARIVFGGEKMYGVYVHQAVIDAYRKGLIEDTAFCMHFVTEEYDQGPVFFEYPIPVYMTDTPERLQKRVKLYEHIFQWSITNLVIHKKISWDGKNPDSLVVPSGYRFLPKKA